MRKSLIANNLIGMYILIITRAHAHIREQSGLYDPMNPYEVGRPSPFLNLISSLARLSQGIRPLIGLTGFIGSLYAAATEISRNHNPLRAVRPAKTNPSNALRLN
jgi:hypothetical protein